MTTAADAQQWHDDNTTTHLDQEEFGACWCCCWVCEQHNPHYRAGMDEMKEKADTWPST